MSTSSDPRFAGLKTPGLAYIAPTDAEFKGKVHAIRDITCPQCGALPGQPCTINGRALETTHQRRVDEGARWQEKLDGWNKRSGGG